ncbi:RagB/SusD family nutrient uptake outer membrane protein [Pelobium sp.]|nr:RagB/SusD family nutrient uptake outer membrane protein [Pelobium sp.]MDA9555561.1 RagB/SusD family nutrient uptake outer membrane protein [Pelobium sp.]
MKKIIKNIASLVIATLVFSGCEKDKFLLDGSTTDGSITGPQVWDNNDYARGVLNNAYFTVAEGFSLDGNGAMLASACDEAVNSNQGSSINILNNGTWSAVRTFDDVYNEMYAGIRKVNLFLENAQKSGIVPIDNLTKMEDIERMRGEAFFLRAYFHFELLKRYGAIPLVTKVLATTDDLNLPRNTYDECVNQISLDCDSAIARLPEWTGDNGTKSPRLWWRSGSKGRATQTAAMALKSRMLLYAASPLNNPGGDLTKWQKAADAAKRIIDLNDHSLLTSYTNVFNYSAAAYNNEVIFATQPSNRNDLEINQAPISYNGGTGRTNPTQDLVDAFGMANGKAILDPTSGYDPNNPYNARDPRLKFTINYNGLLFKGIPVETFVGGKDGLNNNANATKTGYYMRKFLSESATWNVVSPTNQRRPWVVFRYAEVLLNYAEALNEAQGPVADVYKYLNAVRQRTGVALPALLASSGLTKDQMRALIQNERRVELCFEGHRFFDVRRWKLGETLFNKPVNGMRITVNPNSTLNYTKFQVENRVFTAKNYLFPFSQSDLSRQPALVQNTGW